jgi:deoxyribodipyrimidine photo-lyase
MSDQRPVIVWFRRDLRLADHPALTAAVAMGRPVVPLFIHDETVEALGAAPKFRLGLAVDRFAATLAAMGSRLTLRRGRAADVLTSVIAETGAGAVVWSRLYEPDSTARDRPIKAALKDANVEARSFPGHVLFEPWTVETGQGGFYRVYTPFWKAVAPRDPGALLPAPSRLPAPDRWPASDRLADWQMAAAMRRGAAVVVAHQQVGEAAALDRLQGFLSRAVDSYKQDRDFPALPATSGLSENLTYGEISARTIWWAGQDAMARGARGAEHFLKELVWRDFAWHLIHHTPHIASANWRPEWDAFPWSAAETPAVAAWKQGRTGVPFVDAGMRQMYVTGTMHNRLRMIVGSYLTKHLMAHWKIGLDWFADCLTDWDPASNAMGWQWVAGSGPDAAPYFRVFNPDTQGDKFDPMAAYRNAWIAEGQARPPATALSWFDAVPRSWNLSPADRYPRNPVVSLEDGRSRALAAYAARIPQGNP